MRGDEGRCGEERRVRTKTGRNFRCKLPDWQPRPFKLLNIRDPHLRKFALEINEIWSRLCRKMKPEVISTNSFITLFHIKTILFYYEDLYFKIEIENIFLRRGI